MRKVTVLTAACVALVCASNVFAITVHTIQTAKGPNHRGGRYDGAQLRDPTTTSTPAAATG